MAARAPYGDIDTPRRPWDYYRMTLSIDAASCTRCGQCHLECPSRAVRRESDGAYRILEDRCMRCSHCAAVCPADSVRSDLGPFVPWKSPGLPPEGVAALIRGKRSVRRYADRPVEQGIIDELLLTGSLTATASNAQGCVATVLTGPELDRCHAGIRSAFAVVARLLRSPVVRFLLRFTQARRYVDNPGTVEGLDLLTTVRGQGRDMLFYDAPVVVVLSAASRGGIFARTDCVLAGAHMMLHAESRGLGSCMIGLAVAVLNLRARLRREVGIPARHRVGLVFTLGYPAVRYHRLPQRKPLSSPAGPA